MTRTKEGRRASLLLWGARIAIALTGLILSIVLHELFHIAVHWGDIVSIHILPNVYTVVEVNSITSHPYNTDLEELFAYTITLVTLLVTAVCIAKIHDVKDERSFADTVLPRSSSMKDLTNSQLIDLAYKTGIFK